MKKILLLGSGELGREFIIAAKRFGHHVVAADSYHRAPAMQMADDSRVISMLDGASLDAVVAEIKPDIIVPEIEAIRTERLFDYEKLGIHVVPSARAANMTMNRKAIRDLAATELRLKTARYMYAQTRREYIDAVEQIGIPCIVKPLMSSSGKGQSTVHTAADVQHAWDYAFEGSRGDVKEVIVEEFIAFESEITLLTVTQMHGPTLFCPPIGHRQEHGDYQESWMPHYMPLSLLQKAQKMAKAVTDSLTGAGIWGVEFFLTPDDVYFSELSPRPHDTGMVTLTGCTNLNQFELHARAIFGYPIPEITLEKMGATAVILANAKSSAEPDYTGIEEALQNPNVEIRIFGKPSTRTYRRMGVALASERVEGNTVSPDTVARLRAIARKAADSITIHYMD